MEMTPEKIGLLNAESLLLLRVKRLNKWGTNVGEFYVQQVKTWCGSSAQHLHSDVDRNITACYGYASTNIFGHVVYINPIYPLNLGDYLNNVLKENAFILPLTPVRLALISKKMYSK